MLKPENFDSIEHWEDYLNNLSRFWTYYPKWKEKYNRTSDNKKEIENNKLSRWILETIHDEKQLSKYGNVLKTIITTHDNDLGEKLYGMLLKITKIYGDFD